MNILHIMKDYKPNNGGSVVRNGNMIDTYKSLYKDKIIVLNLDGNVFSQYSQDDGVEIYRCISLYELLKTALKLVKKYEIDIIQAHNFRFLFVGYVAHLLNRKKTSLAVELHAIYRMAPFKEKMSYWLLKQAQLISVLSESAKKYLISSKKINAEQIIVLRNGLNKQSIVDEDSDIAEALEKIHNRNLCIVAYTGSFIKWQGVNFIAENFDYICDKVKNIFFVFLGDGREFEYVKNKIESGKYSSNALIHHGVEKKKIRKIMEYIDIVLIPREKNLTTNTAVPLKAIEAMQMGKCILSSDDDGLTELLNHDNARIFKACNIESLTEKLNELSEDKELRNLLGNQARMDAEKVLHSWNDNVIMLREKYKEILR